MYQINEIFVRIEAIIKGGNNDSDIITAAYKSITKPQSTNSKDQADTFHMLVSLIKNIIQEIDLLATEIKGNSTILISVKNQKLLRISFQIIAALGISTCLIPGLGISLSKRCPTTKSLPPLKLSDEQKYEVLTICVDFLHRSYEIPVMKNIIITFHLSDYLASLIQLAFAPLKKPGVYQNYTMTQNMYDRFEIERQKYIQIYEYLVSNCFQPTLMKELIVLQNISDQTPPIFVKKVIAKELSTRLTVPGGLLSLIRCFMDSPDMDIGQEWRKIDMISKIVSAKHGFINENDYINNITSQLKNIFSINNSKYLATAISCFVSLFERYGTCEQITNLSNEIFLALSYDVLLSKANLPGTIILTPQEVEHSIQILHACTSMKQLNVPSTFIIPNLYVLFMLRMKCSKDIIKSKITDIILKALELIDKTEIQNVIKQCLFGHTNLRKDDILIEEYEAGLAIKHINTENDYPIDKAILNFVEIINKIENNSTINNLFEICLRILINLSGMRLNRTHTETLMTADDNATLLSTVDEKYAHILTLLSEISSLQKVINALKTKPVILINFVESVIVRDNSDDECKTIAIVLLNTILSNSDNTSDIKEMLHNLQPKLKKLTQDKSEYIQILSKETISLISSEYPKANQSKFEKALSNVFDNLLPVRAHGIIELNKLIDEGDPETISKRHYIFCLLQEQLKDVDSYVYLSAINCIASLTSHCTSEVLAVLCKEYLNMSIELNIVETKEKQHQASELRMKIGDIIVKVTRKLGEMAVVHKTTLLNTMLCASRDDDPLIRASAISNLAEIALVINYKMGSIIYEVLLCIWSTIESDKAIECRRAAVMVISNLLKGLGKETLFELKENLLPIYRTLNKLYKDSKEDSIVRLHAQIAIEELNDIVKEILFAELPMEKNITMLKGSNDIMFK